MAGGLPELLAKSKAYLPAGKIRLVEDAFAYAERMHSGQSRLSGEPFIEHPLQTAIYLADLHQDHDTVAAGLLHDVVEDCGVSLSELERRFGRDVAKLVDGVTKLTQIELLAMGRDGDDGPEEARAQAESVRKMLVAMADDIRVVLIKLCDRLHNMRTLYAKPPERRNAIAQETLDIYAPLAHRLGIWDIKWQLEDLAFRYTDEKTYREISRGLATRRTVRERYLDRQCNVLKDALQESGLCGDVYGRPKNIYSIYKKMQKYSAEGQEFREIMDLYALRVLVDTVGECYNALGVVHQLWRPIPGQFDDYIANPKENMYQSIHTSVMCEGGTPLEVQVRTHEMHRVSEYGVAAHWSYKEGGAGDRRFEEKMTWLRQLLEWQREVSGTDEFLESVKTDIFRDQVYVYTPKGEVRELPVGATPIDFAYQIHSDMGHRCIGAKVNGRLAPLETALQNGDTVEIVASKHERGPSMDWLNPALGYVTTASARGKIRQWFRRQERGAHLEQGRDLLARARRRLALSMSDQEVANALRFDSVDELLVALGNGNLTAARLDARLAPPEEPVSKPALRSLPPESPATGIRVLGVGDMLTRTARCCNPLPGDDIVGYITRSRGVTVHRAACSSVLNEDEPERLIGVSWGPSQELHPVRVELTAFDRVGLLRDITTMVAAEKVNIASMVTTEPSDGTAVVTLTLYTTGVGQLSLLFAKLEGVKGAVGVKRVEGLS